MASNAPRTTGYDCTFVEDVSDEYICIICHLVLRKPVQTKCGHRFCKCCLEEAIKRDPKCPIDRQTITQDDIFEDLATERKILSFKIKCPEDPCNWQGELRNVEDHNKQCDFVIVKCDNKTCDVRKPRHEMVEHVQNECEYRMVSCSYCNKAHMFSSLKVHTEECSKVNCPKNCGKRIQRGQVTSHTINECPLTIVSCSYQNIGCSSKVKRKDLDIHNESHIKQHLTIAMDNILSLKTQIAMMNKDDDRHYSYIWNVKNFNQQLQTAKQTGSDIKLYSEPFYTHKYGYRMKLRLDPNGDGVGKGTHVSVFIVIMRGEYDAILTWPFNWVRKFILMDQKPNPTERKNIERTVNSASTEAFKRPTTNENTGIGFPKFLSHELLTTEKYMVDGELFLKLVLEKR